MTVAFRNVEADPDDPVAQWPTEAVRAALERGGLPEWRRLATEIDAEPWGPTARRIEEIIAAGGPYGVGELFGRLIDAARSGAEARERAEVTDELRSLIEASGLSQAEFARRLGTSGSRLSTYVNGSVVPSATLVVRARGVAGR